MKAKILLIDDDAHLRETLHDILEADGYDVSEAGSGAEALKLVVTGFYDVILCDFQLADMTGIDVIHRIRQMNAESQILMMTAHASLDTAVKAIQESVYDFLIKPVEIVYLKRVIEKAVETLRLEQENRRLIAELKKANEELLHFNNMKSKFMSMASHDMSNSLMTLQVSVEMLGQTLSPSDEQKKMLQYIANANGQLSRLIEDLVDWAAIEQGKFRLDKASFGLAQAVEQILPGPRHKAENKKIALSLQAPEDLPQLDGDRRRISQVITNLLENAVRHTQSGGRIDVRIEPEGGSSLHLSVKDSGEGIEPEEASRIFESFYQGSAQGARGRLGLGLSIAREIVTSHGGRIWVESEGKGLGATFHMTLPIGAARKEAARLTAA